MRLRFIADAFYNGKPKYLKGSVHEVSNERGEAQRWLARQVAVEEVVEAKKEKKIEEKIEGNEPLPTEEDTVDLSSEFPEDKVEDEIKTEKAAPAKTKTKSKK